MYPVQYFTVWTLKPRKLGSLHIISSSLVYNTINFQLAVVLHRGSKQANTEKHTKGNGCGGYCVVGAPDMIFASMTMSVLAFTTCTNPMVQVSSL